MTERSEPIKLIEYQKHQIPKAQISDSDGEKLWRKFGKKVWVEYPDPMNNQQWELTSQGYVGFIPISDDLNISISPKIPLRNLFGMWEYAYRLKNIEFLGDLFEANSLQEFYSELANILAKRVIDRSRKGYYRAYIPQKEDLSYLKGKLDLKRMVSTPWIVRPRCSYQEHTADVDENQILAWTLYAILRSGFCSNRALPSIRNAYRHIAHIVTISPKFPNDCINRNYNRLNIDYEPLHSLSRFFLEKSGPSYELGDRKMLPFLVDMAQLFELFVAEWLKRHLPKEFTLKTQESIDIDKSGNITLRIDLVLYQAQNNTPICVLDTKYKDVDHPSQEDIAQINLYSGVMNCSHGILIYPKQLPEPLNEVVNGIHLRSVKFDIHDDLEKGGKSFLEEILEEIKLA